MGYMVQISEDKRNKMSELCEKMLSAGGKLMQCLEDLDGNQRGGDRDDWDDNEYEEEEDYGRYGRTGARKQKHSGRYMR